ncbi:MAG: D-glycero-beta-D-manno-heptose 1-phosphate adenylyltransferase [Candidatus Firestonebacteria bacterium]
MRNKKIKNLKELIPALRRERKEKKKIVFTNGCFDILHVGHIRYLKAAKKLGDVLVLGVNSDASIKRLKGASRPVVNQYERTELLAEFPFIDHIVIFGGDTPLETIKAVMPDFLVKGGDWPVEKIVGNDIVRAAGGKVKSLPLIAGRSTSKIIKIIRGL